MCEKRRLTVRSITEQVNTDRETVRKILTEDLEMQSKAKQRRVTICQDLMERQGDILGCASTGDETCVYQYDPETKRQSAQ